MVSGHYKCAGRSGPDRLGNYSSAARERRCLGSSDPAGWPLLPFGLLTCFEQTVGRVANAFSSLRPSADIQSRDGSVLLMRCLFGLFPFLPKPYADSGCGGRKFQDGPARVCQRANVDIVNLSDVGKFVVLPKRWIAERNWCLITTVCQSGFVDAGIRRWRLPVKPDVRWAAEPTRPNIAIAPASK